MHRKCGCEIMTIFTYEHSKHSVYDIVMENYKLLLVSQLLCSNQACCLLLFSMWSYVLWQFTGFHITIQVVNVQCVLIIFLSHSDFYWSTDFHNKWIYVCSLLLTCYFFQVEHRINTVIDVLKMTSPRVINESTLTIHNTTVGGLCWKHINSVSHCMAVMNG